MMPASAHASGRRSAPRRPLRWPRRWPNFRPGRHAGEPVMTVAVIAEDEPVLRGELRETLTRLWPGLEIAAEAEDGIEALDALDRCKPQVMFLDIEMPGLSGLEVARAA